MNIVELNENDILILQLKKNVSLEAIDKLNRMFEVNKIKIILLPGYVDIAGVKRVNKL